MIRISRSLKHFNWKLIITLAFMMGCFLVPLDTQADTPSESVPVDAVINSVRQALKEAQSNNILGFPPLSEVNLNLKTVAKKSVGGKISFFIFSIGGKTETESVSEIIMKMTPPTTKNTASLQSINIDKLNSTVAQAINTAKAGILAGNTGEPKLQLNNLTIKVEFAVKNSTSGGISTAELLPVGLDGTGELSKNQTHSVTLIFKF